MGGGKNAPDALPRERRAEIYIELRGLNTGSKRISHAVTGSPFSVPMFVRERVKVQVRPRPGEGENLRCDVVSVLICELTVGGSETYQ